VGREYDAWTREKILEHYWGEHIHLGYYTDEEQKKVGQVTACRGSRRRRRRASLLAVATHTLLRPDHHTTPHHITPQGYLRKNFIGAKYDFIDRMMDFARLTGPTAFMPAKVLDVGCGIGGTSRYLAKASGVAI